MQLVVTWQKQESCKLWTPAPVTVMFIRWSFFFKCLLLINPNFWQINQTRQYSFFIKKTPITAFQDGRIDYGEFAAMMRKGDGGVGTSRTMRSNLTFNLADALGVKETSWELTKAILYSNCSEDEGNSYIFIS